MFFKKSKKIAEQARLINDLEQKVKKLETDIRNQEALVSAQERALEKYRSTQYDQEFDIEGMDVYAIEYDYEEKKTVLGYKYSNGMKTEFTEWSFSCSFEQHKRLVARFRSKIKRKARKK